jgi:hypothetical protein
MVNASVLPDLVALFEHLFSWCIFFGVTAFHNPWADWQNTGNHFFYLSHLSADL